MTESKDRHFTDPSQVEKGESGKNTKNLSVTKQIKKLESEKKSLEKKLELLLAIESIDLDSKKAFGWKLPGIEAYAPKYWALHHNVSEETICQWIVLWEVPFIGSDVKTSFILTSVWAEYLTKPRPAPPDKSQKAPRKRA